MAVFRWGHATHPVGRMAAELALAQISNAASDGADADGALGFLYLTDQLAPSLPELTELLRARSGVRHWVGAVGSAICATGVEYSEEPALAIMIGSFKPGSFRVFSGRSGPPGADARMGTGAATGAGTGAASGAQTFDGQPQTFSGALVHADPMLPELPDLVSELGRRIGSAPLFGALTSGQGEGYGQLADEALPGGLSGVSFLSECRLLSRVTQGCAPLAPEHRITACAGNFVQALDGRPALDVMLEDLGVRLPAQQMRSGEAILRALPAQRLREGLFVGLARGEKGRRPGFGDYLVRNLVGIDPAQRVIAVGDIPEPDDRLVLCTRNREAAQRDLVRIIAEMRDEIDEQGLTVRGGLYHSCVSRGVNLFGASGREMETIAHHLGEVPLVGMYGNGEIGGDRIYGHTGVLTLFVA